MSCEFRVISTKYERRATNFHCVVMIDILFFLNFQLRASIIHHPSSITHHPKSNTHFVICFLEFVISIYSHDLGKFFLISISSKVLLSRAPCCFIQAAVLASPSSKEVVGFGLKTSLNLEWSEYA